MKRIRKNIRQFSEKLLLGMLILFAFGCEKDKEIFDRPAIERSRESIASLQEKLKSSEFGWKVSYRPGKGETGYYQFVFRFLKDSVVEMASDFSSEDLMLRKSEYRVIQGSTTKLSFSTFGALHKLSDSNISPLPGQKGAGLKGDFEFLYYGETVSGDLIFRTNRMQDTLIFMRASAASINDLAQGYANGMKLKTGKSVYRSMQEVRSGKVSQSSFDFPYEARVIGLRSVRENQINGTVVRALDEGYITGYGLTPTGIVLDSIRRSNGEMIRNVAFSFNEDENRFVTTLADGTRLTIGDSNEPLIPVDGQKYFLDPALTSYLIFFYKDKALGDLTTPAFNKIFEKVVPIGLTGRFFMIGNPALILLEGKGSISDESLLSPLIFEDKGDRLVMKPNRSTDPSSALKPADKVLYDEFMAFLTDPQGFYVENLGKYTQFSNLVFTFTSVKDPSIRFAVYHVAP